MEARISIITLGVADMGASIRFYRALGFVTDAEEDAVWAIFRTEGARFALHPRERLAADIGVAAAGSGFGGVTLAHNVRERDEVERVLNEAMACGGRLLKAAAEADWGGYSGYFADPDGYPWEVAWAEAWQYDGRGMLWGGPLGPIPPPD